jgi:hypothetical protein
VPAYFASGSDGFDVASRAACSFCQSSSALPLRLANDCAVGLQPVGAAVAQHHVQRFQ